ncbi:MAG: hypothetical protein ACOYYS_02785 [Chloroflexota bacterium]
MDIGMLWFDNDPQTDLAKKVARAAAYYQNKYGQTPNLCFVHPTMLKDQPVCAGAIELRQSHSVLPNHFWLGVHIASN